jgi:hypothetical protein
MIWVAVLDLFAIEGGLRRRLNQGQGGICMGMMGLRGGLDDGSGGGNRVEGIRLGLEDGAAALPDLLLAIGQPSEAGIDMRAPWPRCRSGCSP